MSSHTGRTCSDHGFFEHKNHVAEPGYGAGLSRAMQATTSARDIRTCRSPRFIMIMFHVLTRDQEKDKSRVVE